METEPTRLRVHKTGDLGLPQAEWGVTVVAVDASGEIILLESNPTARAMLALPADGARKLLAACLPTVLKPILLPQLKLALADLTPRTLALPAPRGDSATLTCELFPISAAPDQPVRLVLVCRGSGTVGAEAQQESRFEALVKGSLQGLVVVRDNRAVFCNEAFARIFGFQDVGKALGWPRISDLIHPDVRERAQAISQEIIEGHKAAQQAVLPCVRPDGEAILVQNITSRIEWEGRPALQVTLFDITDQVKSRDTLRDSEIRYRVLVDNSMLGIMVHLDLEPVFANQAAVRMLGYPDPDTFLERTRGKQIPHVSDVQRPEVMQQAAELLSGERDSITLELESTALDGTTRHVQFQSRTVPWEGRTAIMTLLVDITDLKRAEQAIAESEIRYRTLVESSLQGITVHQQGVPKLVNDAYAQLVGYADAAHFMAENGGKVFPRTAPEAADLVRKNSEALESRRVPRADTERDTLTRDGQRRRLRITSCGISWEGKPAVLSSILDLTAYRAAEEQLRASEERYRSLVEGSIQCVAIIQDEGFKFVNEAYAALLGYDSPAEVVALPHIDAVVAPAFLEQIRGYRHSRLSTGNAPARYRYQTLRKDGTTLWVENQASIIQWEGRPAVLSALIDVNQQVLAEAELRRSEEHYRVLVESSIQGVCIVQDSRVQFCSRPLAKMLGYASPEEVTALETFELVIAQESRPDTEHYRNLHLNGEEAPQHYRLRLLRKSGEKIWVETLATVIDWNKRPAVLCTVIDISQQVDAELELRRSEERYRTLAEGSVQGMAVFALADGRALFANEAMCTLSGMSSVARYLREATLFSRVREPYLAGLRTLLKQMAAGEVTQHEGEIQVERVDGSTYWGHFSARTIPWDGEDAVQITVVDISERKRAEEALKERQTVLTRQNEAYRDSLSRRTGLGEHGVIAESAAMLRTLEESELVARSNVPVLIEGPTGSGKEIVAEFIHRHSDRSDQLMSVVNCGALSENLMDAELFGHEKGAFTGATEARAGLIEIADKSTLFLDEIGDLPPSAQVRLLRFLERGVVRRVGSTRERKVDARILAATHKTLKEQVQAGTFREDLYHRLLVIRISVPPLRDRIEDIIPLTHHFCTLACQEARVPPMTFSDEARIALTGYAWPGNVRELAHAVQRAVFAAKLEGTDVLWPEHLDLPVVRDGTRATLSLKEVTQRAERQHVRAVLEHFEGNRRKAAESLGISERTLYRVLGS